MDCRRKPEETPEPIAALDGLETRALALGRSSDPSRVGVVGVLAARLGLGGEASIGSVDGRRAPPRLDFRSPAPCGCTGAVSFGELLVPGAAGLREALVAGVDAEGAPLLLHLVLDQPGVTITAPGGGYLRVTAETAPARRPADCGLVADLAELFAGYEQLGTLLAMFDACLDYIRGRATDDWRLDALPSVRERVADIYLLLLMLRAALDDALAGFRSGGKDEGGRRLALARLAWFDHAPACAAACRELHGGIAAVAGHDMQRLHRRLDDRTRLTRSAAYWRARLRGLP